MKKEEKIQKICRDCYGSGQIFKLKCQRCNGTGLTMYTPSNIATFKLNFLKRGLTLLLLIGLAGCKEEPKYYKYTSLIKNGGINQTVEKNCPIGENFNNPCIMTVVFMPNANIVWYSYIKISSDSATIKHQLDSATIIFNNLKSLK